MADKLKYSNPITVKSYKTDGTEDDGKVISNLSEQINAISDSLGLEDSITLQIKEKFNSYDDKIFTMIVNSDFSCLQKYQILNSYQRYSSESTSLILQ